MGSRQFGGAEHFYVRLVRALKEAGHPVTAICRPGSPVSEELDSIPVVKKHLPLANRWDLWSQWQISRIISKDQPCVVQTYMGRATRLTKVPKGANAVHIARLGGFYKIDGYYRHADAWVGIGHAICDYLVRSGLPANRVHHIGHFVPPPATLDVEEKAALRAKYNIAPEARVVFALGRLVTKKGFDEYFRAITRLPLEIGGRPVVFVLAGDGPEMNRLRELTVSLDIESRVRMVGWQNPTDPFYQIADLFVCPSRHEPLGAVFLEAWNHSLPIVATRSDGAVELIEDGVTGLLCDCRDEAGMAAAIRQILEADDANRVAMAKAGNECLQAKYSQARIVDQYLSLYRDMLAAK